MGDGDSASRAGLCCIVCNGVLVALRVDGADVEACVTCETFWCAPAEFLAAEIGLSVDFRTHGSSELHCPSCRVAMIELRVDGVDPDPVRQCGGCFGWWFHRSQWERVRFLRDERAARRDDARRREERGPTLPEKIIEIIEDL